MFHDVSAARQMSAQLAHLAQHDFLTDLPNRMLLRDRLQQAISSARRRGEHVDLAGKLLAALALPCAISSHRVHISASIGISVYPDDADEADALLGHADTAMYHAKEGGRNDCRFFDRDMAVVARLTAGVSAR